MKCLYFKRLVAEARKYKTQSRGPGTHELASAGGGESNGPSVHPIRAEAYSNSTFEGPRGGKTVAYWWSNNGSGKREQYTSLRERHSKTLKRGATEDERTRDNKKYRECKKELRTLIRLAKKEHWNKLCEDLNRDILGAGYSIAVKRLNNLVPYDIPYKEKKQITRDLFSCAGSRDIELKRPSIG